MSNTVNSRLQTQAFPVDDLVEQVRQGYVRVPSFQRGIRWTRSDVTNLFDSIQRGFPIGNLLLWSRPAKAVPGLRIGALTIDAPETERALFVVDGQQRITALASALSPEGQSDPQYALSFDVVGGTFLPSKPNAPSTQIPLPTLFDLSSLLRWFTDHPELQAEPSYIDTANNAAKAIREFRVPVYVVDQSDPEVLRLIFDRMNNYGKQLTRAEVFTALHEAETGEKNPDVDGEFTQIAEAVHAETAFGVLDDDTIFVTMLARRGHDVSRDIRREFSTGSSEFPGEDADRAREEIRAALVRAISFLQQEADTPRFAVLPNRYLLVVLVRFFAHFPEPDVPTRRQLRRWYWRAAARGPEFFKGSSTGAMRTLASRITPGCQEESIRQLLELLDGPAPVPPRIVNFRTNYSATRILLAALWANGPRRITRSGDLTSYTTDDLATALAENATAGPQVPMLVQGSALSTRERSLAGNRIFLAEPQALMPLTPLDDLQWLAGISPTDRTAQAVLESHVIDATAASLLRDRQYASFVKRRQSELEKYLARFIASRAEWSTRYEAPLATFVIDDEDDQERDDDLDPGLS